MSFAAGSLAGCGDPHATAAVNPLPRSNARKEAVWFMGYGAIVTDVRVEGRGESECGAAEMDLNAERAEHAERLQENQETNPGKLRVLRELCV